jgi:ribosomal-protein-alanine N-acetyltransferase
MKLDLPESINTSRLQLQRLRYEDAEEIFYAYANKAEATQYVSWPTHQSLADTRKFLAYAVGAWSKGTDYSYAIRAIGSTRLIGSFGIINNEGKIQFGYILSPTQWGHGYATEVCQRMMSKLIMMQGVRQIGTFVDCDNVASSRVLLKSGLIVEARKPEWFRFVNQGDQLKDCFVYNLPLM